MAEKKLYGATFGPYLYEDTDSISDPDSEFPDMLWDASVSNGIHLCAGVRFLDSDQSNHLTITWGEGDDSDRTLGLLVAGGNRLLTLNENFTIGDGTDITITGVTAARSIVLNENLVIAGGFDFTLQALGQANQLTLNEGFTIGDGSVGTLTYSSVCTLTVELASVLNQDLTTDANVAFATVNAITLTAVAVGFTVAGGTTPKALTVDDDFVVSTQLAAIAANTAKLTCDFTNVQTALAAASGAVDLNSQNLTGVGTIASGAITVGGNISIVNELNTSPLNDGNATLYINYRGYDGGATRFRDLRICDGKNSARLVFDGSADTFDIIGHDASTKGLKLGGTLVTASAAEINRLTQIYTGSYTGDGSTSKAITGVGFTPRYVRVWRAGADGAPMRAVETTTEMMARDAQGMALFMGSGVATFYDNKILSIDADGFTISDEGSDLDPNTQSQVYDFICFG